MEQKERDQEIINETRRQTKDGRFLDCPCTALDCPRHGICSECTAIHRNNRALVPACLRPLVERTLKERANGNA